MLRYVMMFVAFVVPSIAMANDLLGSPNNVLGYEIPATRPSLVVARWGEPTPAIRSTAPS